MPENEKNWSLEDIDELLSRTGKFLKNDSAVVENFARTMRLADSAPSTAAEAEKNARVETIEFLPPENGKPSVEVTAKAEKNTETGDIVVSTRTAKQRVADAIREMGIKPSKHEDDQPEQLNLFDEPDIAEYAEKTAEDPDDAKADENGYSPSGNTKIISRSVVSEKRIKDAVDSSTREITKTIRNEEAKTRNSFAEKETDENSDDENWADGQIKFSGFENQDDAPDKITEEEAEENVRKNRRDKISKFRLMGIAEAEENSQEKDKSIEKLFTSQNPIKKPGKERVNNAGVEYTEIKNANRIRATLHRLKSLSLMKTTGFTVITAVMLILNIISAVSSGYETKLLQIIDFILLAACILMGTDCINKGVIAFLKREPDMKSAVTAASLAALVQSICIMLGSSVLNYHSFMISGCAAAGFALNEYGEYLRHARTYDAFNFCTGKMRRKLFSVHEIDNKNDRFEIGTNLLMKSPDVRYSCRTKFPARLIEHCESDVSSDKLQTLLLPITLIGSAVCGILGGIFEKNFLGAVSAWAAALCVCVPSFGIASIQLPMRWANKRLNKAGGLITDQRTIENYSKTNSIILDSAELFDSSSCQMHGFKDFKRVRVDDIMLYSAAMMTRAGGPLAEVFAQVVSNRELLPEVRSFSYEDRMGISGWINGQKVIMGNRNMMKHHNFILGDESEEEKYTHDGRKVIYLAIANSLAAMIVVSYAPDKKLKPFIKRLGTDGVTILLRNNDSNITTDMINETYGVRFNNIRLVNSTVGRLFKKYRGRVRETSKSGIIHDGKAFSFMRSFTMSYSLCGTFKAENLIQLINVAAGIIVTGVLACFKVFSTAGMWPLIVFQAAMTAAAFITARLRGIF